MDVRGDKTVLMEHPPKQGLKLKSNSVYEKFIDGFRNRFNGTSTKTRIETGKSEGN